MMPKPPYRPLISSVPALSRTVAPLCEHSPGVVFTFRHQNSIAVLRPSTRPASLARPLEVRRVNNITVHNLWTPLPASGWELQRLLRAFAREQHERWQEDHRCLNNGWHS